jgi:NTE family protein
MRAFVLSGGGNMGATQVGALRALFERNILPDILIGCSAGALNAGFLARELSLTQIEHLAQVWQHASKQIIYPGSRLHLFWRFIRGKDSLFDNRSFYAFLQRHGATPAQIFGSVTASKLYITATRLHDGHLHVFGDNPNDRVLDAMMASTALTPMHPPYEVDGVSYIDGGTVTPLPLRVALERGASEIYALHIIDGSLEQVEQRLIRGVTGLINHSVSTMLRLQAQHDLLLAEVKSRAKLHYLPLHVVDRPDPLDFSQSERLVEFGYQAALDYFEQKKQGREPRHASKGFMGKMVSTVRKAFGGKSESGTNTASQSA